MPYDYLIPTVLFFIVLVGCIYHLGRYLPSGPVLLFILCVALVPKYAALTSPYYGTEYEDAFVFQADSKSLTDHVSESDPFRVQIADYNIEKKGDELRSYNGHFTSFSGLIWLTNKTFGYSRVSAIELNLLFSCLLFLILYLTVFTGTNSKTSASISVLILASSPIINLFQTSALAETYSSFMTASFLYFLVRYWKNQKISHSDTLFLVTSLLLCLLIKRENMVLLSVLPLISYKLFKYRSFSWASLLGLALLLYFAFVRPFSTEFLEASSIETATFSFSYLLVQLPVYVSALLKPQLYGIAFFTLCILLATLFHNRKRPSPESLVVMGIFVSYLAIYCLHYRSRYFVQSMEMGDFETFRYANNFFYLIPLFIGLNLKAVVGHWYTSNGYKYLTGFFVIVFAVSVYFSQAARVSLQPEEFNTRIYPLLIANRIIRGISDDEREPVLVTDIPVVGKMLDDSEFSIFVQEFRFEYDYLQYQEREPLYFLLPRQLATEYFGSNPPLEFIPLEIDTRYVLYRLL